MNGFMGINLVIRPVACILSSLYIYIIFNTQRRKLPYRNSQSIFVIISLQMATIITLSVTTWTKLWKFFKPSIMILSYFVISVWSHRDRFFSESYKMEHINLTWIRFIFRIKSCNFVTVHSHFGYNLVMVLQGM